MFLSLTTGAAYVAPGCGETIRGAMTFIFTPFTLTSG
jgi:hypothetical protein